MKIRYNVPENIDAKNPAIRCATWFGCGFMNPAPGTWGSFGALPFGILLMLLGGPILLIVAICSIFPLGLWAAHEYGKISQEHDSKQIVIDEVVGMWIAMISAALNPLLIIFAFVAFRFFDIFKPWPVSFADKKIKNAGGVMLDDVMAGLYACLCVVGLDVLL